MMTYSSPLFNFVVVVGILMVVGVVVDTTHAFSPKNPIIQLRTQPPAFTKDTTNDSSPPLFVQDTLRPVSSVTGNTQVMGPSSPTKAFHRSFQFQKGCETRLQQQTTTVVESSTTTEASMNRFMR
mmetsp:Transcript_28605/g.43927  ORF Transcript_28605/g.43927 Transcript_28605/m.43927 type:complete len:125 (+) Transcript_28605:164-538(+)